MMNLQQHWHAAGMQAEDNMPANAPAGSMEPSAKRPRLDQRLDRTAVVDWIAEKGAVTGPQLMAQFGETPGLASLLDEMCGNFEICRKGGNAATSSAIELDDPDVQYIAL
jgi:hypothetical protein